MDANTSDSTNIDDLIVEKLSSTSLASEEAFLGEQEQGYNAQERLTYFLVKNNYREAIHALNDGADANFLPDSFGFESPLHLAIQRDNNTLIHALAMNGANINGKPDCEFPPLHSAVFSCKKQSVDTLLRYKADVNKLSKDGKTPLHMLLLSDEFPNVETQLSMLETLIRNGAKISDENLVWYAYENHDEKILKALLHNQTITLNQKHLQKLVFKADDDNAQKLGHLLHYAKSNVNHVREKDGYTPLHRAAEMGYTKLAETLLQCGADTTIRDKEFKTPIEIARSCRHYEIIDAIEKSHVSRSNEEKKQVQGRMDDLEERIFSLEEQLNDQKLFYEEKLLDQVFILQQQQNQIQELKTKLAQVIQYVLKS